MTTEEQQKLPRGVRIFTEAKRKAPHVCQWRVDGKRRTKFFETIKARDKFAKGLAGDNREFGEETLRLPGNEVAAWQRLRGAIGFDASLDAVAACWLRHGKDRPVLTVSEAIADRKST